MKKLLKLTGSTFTPDVESANARGNGEVVIYPEVAGLELIITIIMETDYHRQGDIETSGPVSCVVNEIVDEAGNELLMPIDIDYMHIVNEYIKAYPKSLESFYKACYDDLKLDERERQGRSSY